MPLPTNKKKAEVIQTRNQLDALVYQSEKSLTEFNEKVEAGLKSELESALSKAKSVLAGEDVEAMKASTEELNKLNGKLAEHVYSKAAPPADGAQAQDGAQASGPDGATQGSDKKDDDVVDADFKEV